MPILGTKKFWKPASGTIATQKANQILKNSGYINLQLRTVNYMSKGNFWQSIFGGKDKIALTTTLKYQTGVESIEATSVQDVREVKVDQNYNLGVQQNIAVKIPAISDAIAINVKFTALKQDVLQAKFEMLNQPEYREGLELAPTVVGQVLTITSLVKNLFTETDPKTQLEATYAAIISAVSEDNPVTNGKLTQGLLIMISTDEGDKFEGAEDDKFNLKGDTLYYDDKQVENTYVVFNITFESVRGDNEKANWFKKYNEALNHLDKIMTKEDAEEIKKIYDESRIMWEQGNSLLEADETYIQGERGKLKAAAYSAIKSRYSELNPVSKPKENVGQVLFSISSNNIDNLINSLPATGSFVEKSFSESGNVNNAFVGSSFNADKVFSLIEKDTEAYMKELEKYKVEVNFTKK